MYKLYIEHYTLFIVHYKLFVYTWKYNFEMYSMIYQYGNCKNGSIHCTLSIKHELYIIQCLFIHESKILNELYDFFYV